jgi:hypothetical protein
MRNWFLTGLLISELLGGIVIPVFGNAPFKKKNSQLNWDFLRSSQILSERGDGRALNFFGEDQEQLFKVTMDTIPTSKSQKIVDKDISKEAVEDSDFVIKNPKHTIQITRSAVDSKGKPLINVRLNSRKAWLFSLVVPGLGQYYNHSYIKIPIVYGGLIAGALVLGFYQTLYQQAFDAYKIRLIDPGSTSVRPEYNIINVPTTDELNTIKNFYRRSRDLSVIGITGVWLLNVVDAFVVSELKGFDVSNDLSFYLRPALILSPISGNSFHLSSPLPGNYIGFKLSLNFH